MANENTGGDLSKYVAENNTPLDADNYNEVDGLVFAELSYQRFEDIKWDDSVYEDGITIKDFADACIQQINDNPDKYPPDDHGTEDKLEFLESLSNSERYMDLKVTDMEAMDGHTHWDDGHTNLQMDDGQWAGLTVKLDDDTSVVAFRGTNGTSLGWNEDGEISYDVNGTAAQNGARRYLENTDANRIYTTGHSKGGNDAEYAAATADPETRAKIVRVDNYDGPANNDAVKFFNKEGFEELETKQHNHYTSNTIIGQLNGVHPGDNNYYAADTTDHKGEGLPIGEHDPYSWKIDPETNQFVTSDQSDLSKYLDKAIEDTLKDFNYLERLAFVNALKQMGFTSLLDEGIPTPLALMRIYLGLKTSNAIDRLVMQAFLYDLVWSLLKQKALYDAEQRRKKLEEAAKKAAELAKEKYKEHATRTAIRFMIIIATLKKIVEVYTKTAPLLGKNASALKSVRANLEGSMDEEVLASIDMIYENLLKEQQMVFALRDGLDSAISAYDTAETNVSNRIAISAAVVPSFNTASN